MKRLRHYLAITGLLFFTLIGLATSIEEEPIDLKITAWHDDTHIWFVNQDTFNYPYGVFSQVYKDFNCTNIHLEDTLHTGDTLRLAFEETRSVCELTRGTDENTLPDEWPKSMTFFISGLVGNEADRTYIYEFK